MRGEGIGIRASGWGSSPRPRESGGEAGLIPRPRGSGGEGRSHPSPPRERGRGGSHPSPPRQRGRGQGEGVTAHAGAARKVEASTSDPSPGSLRSPPSPRYAGRGILCSRGQQSSIPRPRESGGEAGLIPRPRGSGGEGRVRGCLPPLPAVWGVRSRPVPLTPHPARCARHPLPAMRGEGSFAREGSRVRSLAPARAEGRQVSSLAPAVAGERAG